MVCLSKAAGYVSRAAFKLKQIQTKHKIISPGSRVLDLGCAPGAWMQVSCQEIKKKKKKGRVLGIDIQEIQIPRQHCDGSAQFIQADAKKLTPQYLEQHGLNEFDVVLSDMMGFTSGNADVDVGQSLDLCATALQLATGYASDLNTRLHEGVLVAGGNLVMKIFEGSGTQEFIAASRPLFESISRVRPKATRKASREFYIVCKGRVMVP